MVGQFEQRRRRTPDSSAQTAKREADERSVRRVRLAAEAYYARTQALIAATGKPIYHAVHDARTGPGFALDVGRWPALQVDLVADTWCVTVRNRLRNVFRVTFATDDALLSAKDDILEPLVANALAALERGSESPADDRGRRKTTSPSVTTKAPRRTTVVPVPLRPAMLAVYAVAFAAGFVLEPLLFVKPVAAPPPAELRYGRAVHQPPTVAITIPPQPADYVRLARAQVAACHLDNARVTVATGLRAFPGDSGLVTVDGEIRAAQPRCR